jgi:hypothetical protein
MLYTCIIKQNKNGDWVPVEILETDMISFYDIETAEKRAQAHSMLDRSSSFHVVIAPDVNEDSLFWVDVMPILVSPDRWNNGINARWIISSR